MERVVESDTSAVWEQLAAAKGTVVVEPAPTGGQDTGTRAHAAARQRYEEAVRQEGKGLLLAVYRGRMSEGVSFDDDFARCVVCVGIPFPNLTEERLAQKRSCNDFWARRGLGAVTGDAWYESKAFQAVAQALGRCIRHPRDYGALVLLDSRWVELGKASNLPHWLRPFQEDHVDARDAATSLEAHFRDLKSRHCSAGHELEGSAPVEQGAAEGASLSHLSQGELKPGLAVLSRPGSASCTVPTAGGDEAFQASATTAAAPDASVASRRSSDGKPEPPGEESRGAMRTPACWKRLPSGPSCCIDLE